MYSDNSRKPSTYCVGVSAIVFTSELGSSELTYCLLAQAVMSEYGMLLIANEVLTAAATCHMSAGVLCLTVLKVEKQRHHCQT